MENNFIGFAHIAIYVRDREESIRFYVDHLKFKVIYRGVRNEGLPTQMNYTLLRMKDCIVELLAPVNFDDERQKQMHVRGAVDHFGLVVKDLDAVINEFKKDSIKLEGPVCIGGDLFEGFKSAFVRGPSGERIELFEFTNGAYEKYYL